MALSVVILAAGKGTRMRSSLPKVLHPIAHQSMLEHVIDAAKALNPDDIQLVYGFGGDQMQQHITDPDIQWALQSEQLGTGHAVKQAMPDIKDEDDVLILYADVPLIRVETLQKLIAVKPEQGIGLLTVDLVQPAGYGRILRKDGEIVGIREHKDATAQEHLINEVNTGILIANGEQLKGWLNNLSSDNAQQEYYLTDIIEMAHQQDCAIKNVQPVNALEVEGANNRVQLSTLEREYQRLQAEQLMLSGATLRDPARIDIRGDITVGQDVVIDVNVILEGKVTLGKNVKIGANSSIKNCTIGDNSVVKSNTVVEDAVIGEDCSVGPFARIRPGSHMLQNSHVGNFVEMKKTTLGVGAKAGHLSYLGDAEIGSKVNIGAGTITCNYDGVNKSKTVIGDGAFIGSNSSLVAPVNIGKNATVGAGSTVNKTVNDDDLAIGRGKQVNLKNWKRPVKRS
ncbi:MAG: bifunctional UDP-N-acetylglucosamine pyrophosphorylase/glucosamine-1-phosphate N-acetyltransferase [Phenylobacterium sp.]|jgi:bifunctional UDP-N-acetylglucosamine pyrophosphorylase/glucosamine-1-phosphate N-acetyltransferase